jgi:hypothetical protein
MTNTRAVIFLGPSLPVATARTVLDAVYLPPAKQADIVSAIRTYRPNVIGLIDGEFGQSLSVWHKEILFALDEGIAVFGASSMGALRAAETSVYGTIGIGAVYEMYASGELTDDDEVALSHGPAEADYLAMSLPMVNIRFTVRRAVDEGVMDEALATSLLAIAKALYFPDRTLLRLVREATTAGIPADAIDRFRRYATDHYCDIKRDDALALLAAVRDWQPPAARPAPAFTFNRSHLFETLANRDRRVRHDGVEVPLAAIANYAALHRADYNALNDHALNRALVGVLADTLDVSVADEDVASETARFRLRRGLTEDAALDAWCERNDLDQREFAKLMRECARCRLLQRWVAARLFASRTVRIVLDELRLRGEYEAVARDAARQERILEDQHALFRETSYQEWSTPRLVVDHLRETPCRMDAPFPVWAEDAGFHSTADLRVELLRARLAREFTAHVSDEVVRALESAPADA